MLREFLIVCLCIAAARGHGEFSVLSSPKSLSFKGSYPLNSNYVSDVLYAATGFPVAEDAEWKGLIVNDPFSLASGAVVVHVDGTSHINLKSVAKTYPLGGSGSSHSLSVVGSELEAYNEHVCNIDFNELDDAISNFHTCFGDIPQVEVPATNVLNSAAHNADKQFLQSIGLINSAADNMKNMAVESNFLIFKLTLESIVKAHGEQSEALTEANKLLSSAIENLNAATQKSSQNRALFIVIANAVDNSRSKREVVAPSTDNTLNLANYVSPDYPVMFNIILWFIVAFFLSLLAICYAIATMDPGRDSIIYRMTSTRMKKDN